MYVLTDMEYVEVTCLSLRIFRAKLQILTQESGAHADDIQYGNDRKQDIREPTNQYWIQVH